MVSLSRAVAALIRDLRPLSAEQAALAAIAADLADAMSSAPPYAKANLARELRNALAQLAGSPPPILGVTDAELDEMLRGHRS